MVVIIEASVSTIETMEDCRYAAMLDKNVKILRSILHVGGSEKRVHFGRIKGTSTVVTLWSAGRVSVGG